MLRTVIFHGRKKPYGFKAISHHFEGRNCLIVADASTRMQLPYGPMERMMLSGWWKQGLVGVLFMVIFASAPVLAQDEFEEVSQPRCSGVEQDGVIVFGAEGGECVIRGELIRPNVSTICVGLAASMGTVLLCAGTKGKRYALPNATIHMHQPAGGAQGQASDIAIAAKEILRVQDILREILSKHTSQPLDKIARDTDRDFYLNAEQAVEYGLIDQVLHPQEEAKKT